MLIQTKVGMCVRLGRSGTRSGLVERTGRSRVIALSSPVGETAGRVFFGLCTGRIFLCFEL